MAVAERHSFKVVSQREEVSFETFRDILASGDNDAILTFLGTANLAKGEKGFSFGDILWLLKDKEMFKKVTDVLWERRYYDGLIWNYGFYHKDITCIKESLANNKTFMKRVGTFFESSLVQCTKENNDFKHLDYFPLVNSRAHKVGDDINAGILNVQFRETYERFLKESVEKMSLDNSDWMSLTYYLLLQDRVQEAMECFSKVSEQELERDSSLKI